MFREKPNWKKKILKPIIIPVLFGLTAIVIYFSLFAGLQSISSFIAKGFNLDTNAEIIKATNATFGAMLVAMATIYLNLANGADKDKRKRIQMRIINLHKLKRRFSKIHKNIEEINSLSLNQNLNMELKQILKNKLDEIKKIEDEVIEMIVEIEHFDLYKKSNLFFETIHTEEIFKTKNDLKKYLLNLEGNLRELINIIVMELASYIRK